MTPTPTPQPILIEMAGGGSFWDSPLFIAVLTLAGVLVGALVTFLLSSVQQKRKSDLELQQRFFDKVLDYSSQMVSAADRLRVSAFEFSHHLRTIETRTRRKSLHPRLNELNDEMDTLLNELVAAHSSLKLIAPQPLREAAAALTRRTRPLFMGDRTSASLSSAQTEIFEANKAFQQAVRKQFNVND